LRNRRGTHRDRSVRLLTPKVSAVIGQEETFTAPEPFSGSEFRYFAMALGDDNPRWRSGEAPPTFVCESSQYLDNRNDLLQGGHRWNLPVTGSRVIRGGNEYEFHRPVRAGDRLTVTWRLRDLQEKTGSGGEPLLIVLSEAEYRDQSGELLASNLETLIYRGDAPRRVP
jgi:hypothetical protein